MKSYPVHLHFTQPTSKPFFYVSKELCQQFNLQHQRLIEIQCGSQKTKAYVIKTNIGKHVLGVSPLLRQRLLIPYQGLIHMKRTDTGVRLGPVVGILTTVAFSTEEHPLGGRTSFFKHLLSIRPDPGSYYFVFTPEQVNWDNMSVEGFFLTDDHTKWQKKIAPLPDVVYDRVPNRTMDRTKKVIECKERIKNLHIPMFNQGFFNKWNIHQRLSNHPAVKEYIPETYMVPSLRAIQKMLSRHQMIYLKPSGGSLGLGIIKVTHHPVKGLLCRYRKGNHNVLRQFDSVQTMMDHLFAGTKRLQNYLVQQGIQLAKVNNRPVDFRIHLNKNRENQWKITGIGAKVAGWGSVTTHVRTGGTITSSQNIFHTLFGPNGDVIRQNLEDAAIRLAETLEFSFSEPLGELGFDIGIDKNGHIWMFEANSKPGRSIFKHPSLKTGDQLSCRSILDYGFYLSQF
ncbi:YheC/YheD family protein [Microaerobacter geothermalis]|uniref:YheC/YheD family endospore coat-associated protein n=1 Tax=Microaerobacter geothermalis TaxID=674972 RepID=UPI001F3C786D|nr:YheC/YheD family protein [Microaerobacter geothermalis]MCF6094618.1 YheC/YheD family protein [Microaerobacter geothermalis]